MCKLQITTKRQRVIVSPHWHFPDNKTWLFLENICSLSPLQNEVIWPSAGNWLPSSGYTSNCLSQLVPFSVQKSDLETGGKRSRQTCNCSNGRDITAHFEEWLQPGQTWTSSRKHSKNSSRNSSLFEACFNMPNMSPKHFFSKTLSANPTIN